MNNNQRGNSWFWVVVVVAVVAYGLWAMSQNISPGALVSAPANPVTENGTAINGPAPTANLSYAQALVRYAGARIQLDAKCQADAQSQKITVKNNSYVMLDNRAAVARSVHVGAYYEVPAYGFKIVQISTPTFPATWKVDCGASQNVSVITIQK